MSIGNTIDEGNKGRNFPWQLKMLLGQQCACDQLEKVANFTAQTASNTDQVEFLLTSILTTLQAGTEYEAKFVLDTCDGNKLYLEVRVWNTDTSSWGPITYYIPGSSTPVIPANPSDPCLQYADSTAVLGLILAELQTHTTILQDIDNNTDGVETLLTNILAAYSAGQQACASSLSVTLCTEQGTTLSGILTELQSVLDVNVNNATLAVTQSGAWTVTSNQGTTPWVVSGTVALDAGTLAALETITVLQGTSPWIVETNTTVRTPGLIRATGAGSIAAGARSISVYNAGSAAGSILGGVGNILPGEILNFSAGGENDTLSVFAYNGTGTTLVITTIV